MTSEFTGVPSPLTALGLTIQLCFSCLIGGKSHNTPFLTRTLTETPSRQLRATNVIRRHRTSPAASKYVHPVHAISAVAHPLNPCHDDPMRRVTIVNRSEDIVNCRAEKASKRDSNGDKMIFPGASMTLEVDSFRVALILTPQSVTAKSSSVDEKWSVAPNGFAVRGSLALTAIWKAVPVPEKCPWIIYRIKVCCYSVAFSLVS